MRKVRSKVKKQVRAFLLEVRRIFVQFCRLRHVKNTVSKYPFHAEQLSRLKKQDGFLCSNMQATGPEFLQSAFWPEKSAFQAEKAIFQLKRHLSVSVQFQIISSQIRPQDADARKERKNFDVKPPSVGLTRGFQGEVLQNVPRNKFFLIPKGKMNAAVPCGQAGRQELVTCGQLTFCARP